MSPQDFVSMGIAVIPVFFRTKRPEVNWRKYENVLPKPRDIDWWFRPGRSVNVAVVCGWQGLTILDFDTEQSAAEWETWAIGVGGQTRVVAEESYRVRTSRGIHVYTLLTQTPRCGKISHRGASWGDYKGTGGIALIPPSVHPSGALYEALNASSIVSAADLGTVIPEVVPVAPPRQPSPTFVHVYPRHTLFPPAPVEKIKAAMSILDFFPDAKPSGNGRWFMARCPWHDDRSPSLRVDTTRQIAFCWSGCLGDKGLDSIGVYAKIRGITNETAIKELSR